MNIKGAIIDEMSDVPWGPILGEEINMRLPWHVTCGLACRAMIDGVRFDDAVEAALSAYLESEKKFRGW